MALQSDPPIKLSEVAAEFDGPMELGAYLRGGTYVPDTPWNSHVPTNYPLRLLDLLGTRADIVTITDDTYEDHDVKEGFGEEAEASCEARFDTNGELYIIRLAESNFGTSDNWLRPTKQGIGSDYEIRAEVLDGDWPVGPAIGSWHRLTSYVGWSVSAEQVFGGGTSMTFSLLLIEVRTYPDGDIIGSGEIEIVATAERV